MATHTQNGNNQVRSGVVAGNQASATTGTVTTVPQDLAAVEIVDVVATLTSAAAATPVTLLSDAEVGPRRRVRSILFASVVVTGATAYCLRFSCVVLCVSGVLPRLTR